MAVTTAPTYEFSVEEYHKLSEAGIFHEDDRIELLNGNLVIMPAIGVRHMKAVRRMNNVFAQRYGARCLVDAQNPARIDGRSEPQPDILLLCKSADERDSAPIPEDVLLLVEVADSSLHYDNSEKREAYARNGIVEYWILDLTRDELLVFRDPRDRAYRTELRFQRDESVAPLAFTDSPVAVKELLPK